MDIHGTVSYSVSSLSGFRGEGKGATCRTMTSHFSGCLSLLKKHRTASAPSQTQAGWEFSPLRILLSPRTEVHKAWGTSPLRGGAPDLPRGVSRPLLARVGWAAGPDPLVEAGAAEAAEGPAGVLLLVLHRLAHLRLGLAGVVEGLLHVELDDVEGVGLLLHQHGHLQEELVHVADAALQPQQLAVAALDLVEGRPRALHVGEQVLREHVPLSLLEHVLDLVARDVLAHDLELALDADLAVGALLHLGLVVLVHGALEGARERAVLRPRDARHRRVGAVPGLGLLAQRLHGAQLAVDVLAPGLDVLGDGVGVALDAAEAPHGREEAGVLLPQPLHVGHQQLVFVLKVLDVSVQRLQDVVRLEHDVLVGRVKVIVPVCELLVIVLG